MTQGVARLPETVKAHILNRVRFFDDFTEENDPYSEHDFGSFQVDGSAIFFKIDYYDEQCQSGSEDPADPEKTTRVLTILKSEEW